jgi:hypothetical protein
MLSENEGFSVQVSAPPPAKKAASLIVKETFDNVAIMVGAAHPTFLQVVLMAP